MAVSEFHSRNIYNRVFRVKCTVCQFVRLLHMHNLIHRTVHFKKTGVDERSVSDTSDNCHFCTAHNVGVQASGLDKILYAGYIFFCCMWF